MLGRRLPLLDVDVAIGHHERLAAVAQPCNLKPVLADFEQFGVGRRQQEGRHPKLRRP